MKTAKEDTLVLQDTFAGIKVSVILTIPDGTEMSFILDTWQEVNERVVLKVLRDELLRPSNHNK